jgi:fructosamine-3-kinase
VSGGDVCDVWQGTLDDGTEVVAKGTPYPAAVESEGLAALAAAGAPVPGVLGVGEDVLVLQHVRGEPDWAGLGYALARLHDTTGDSYGWHRENRLGLVVQHNGRAGDWPTFYGQRRLRPHLATPALPAELRRRLERALDGLLQDLLPARPAASLVHGDLADLGPEPPAPPVARQRRRRPLADRPRCQLQRPGVRARGHGPVRRRA